jgi:hypothetical protein
MCQYQFVNSLIVLEIDFLNVQKLFGFLDLLPEVFRLVHHIYECLALALQGLDQVFGRQMLCARVYLELISELIETTSFMISDSPLTTD